MKLSEILLFSSHISKHAGGVSYYGIPCELVVRKLRHFRSAGHFRLARSPVFPTYLQVHDDKMAMVIETWESNFRLVDTMSLVPKVSLNLVTILIVYHRLFFVSILDHIYKQNPELLRLSPF